MKHIQKEKIICLHWDSNQWRVNALGYLRVRQTTTLS